MPSKRRAQHVQRQASAGPAECRAGLLGPQARSATTGLRSTPMPLTSTSTTSPSFMNSLGVRRAPTPPGVPETITSPGSRGRMVEV